MDKKKEVKVKKKDMNFQSVDSLQQVVNVVNEAGFALNDKSRTIRESAIPEVLAGHHLLSAFLSKPYQTQATLQIFFS